MAPCAYPKCAWNKKRRACNNPNAWVMFLMTNGGKGLTRAQLSQSYWDLKNREGDNLKRWACRTGKRSNRHQNTKLEHDIDMCLQDELFSDPPRNHSFGTLWRKAERLAKTTKYGKWTSDFDVEWVTADRLEKLARLIDEVFCSSSLLDYIVGRTSVFAFEAAETIQNADMASMVTCSSRQGNVHNVKIVFNRSVYRRMGRNVQTGGLVVLSRLQWTLHTLAHELVHAMLYAACPGIRQDHGPVFTKYNENMFGHRGHMYAHDVDLVEI